MSPALIAALEKLFAGPEVSSMAGTASTLGVGSGQLDSLLAKFASGGGVRGFGNQQALGGGLRQVSEIQRQMAQAAAAMQAQQAHSASMVSGYEDPTSFYHSPQMGAEERAKQAQAEQQHQQQMQAMQKRMLDLQARAAATLNPSAAGGLARIGAAGRMGLGAAAVQAGGAAFQNYAVQPMANALGFAGGPAGNIAGDMAGTATQAGTNIASGAMSGASLGMMAGGPIGAGVGAAIGALATGASEISKLPGRIRDWSETLLSSQRTISKYSGVLSQAFAQRDVRQIRRDITSASITGGTTSELSKSLENLYDAIRPMKDTITVQLASGLQALVELTREMVPVLKAIMDAAFALNPGLQKLKEATEDATRQREFERRRRSRVAGGVFNDAITRMMAEDPHKPRQAPRR